MFSLYSTDIDTFYKNLMSSKSFPKLKHFSISISFPPQFVQMDMIEGCVAIGLLPFKPDPVMWNWSRDSSNHGGKKNHMTKKHELCKVRTMVDFKFYA